MAILVGKGAQGFNVTLQAVVVPELAYVKSGGVGSDDWG